MFCKFISPKHPSMNPRLPILLGFFLLFFLDTVHAQHEHHSTPTTVVNDIPAQPLLAQAIRLKEALSYLGSAMSQKDEKRLISLQHQPPGGAVVKAIQEILDPYCI